ncbi:MAG: DNA polymerase III subunit alpha [Chloroflexi bacterium]|nr:DNA polymerase III subunit alpha [Chloroflexota bacterium]
MTTYIELRCHSAYSLLDGASTVEALVAQAAALGMPALALTDHDALYGAVPFVEAAHAAGVRPLLGAELTMEDGHHLTLLVEDETGWRNLCHLITAAQLRAPKGQAALPWATLAARAAGLICLSGCRRGPVAAPLLRWDRQAAFRAARRLAGLFPGRFYIELQHHLGPDDAVLVDDLHRLAGYLGLPSVATNNVHYARREGQRLHDTLSAIRRRLSLDALAPELRPNDECYLKPAGRMRPLFALYPDALATTLRIAERCRYTLRFGLQDLPAFPTPAGCAALDYLRRLCATALPSRYGTASTELCARLDYELAVIGHAGLANYFLIVWDIVRFARAAGIRCQGRGSAANSLVAYLLGIGPIDPLRHKLVFERFLSPERPVLPDIDLDVDAARREEVIQYLYQRYGAEHVALACTFITFQARSALNEVAKALGLDPTALQHAEPGLEVARLPSDPVIALLVELCRQIHGLPRHLGQHSGGMVLMGPPVAERVPTEPTAMPGRSVTQWDRDALETAGIVKIDVLGLRALSAISEALEWMRTLQLRLPDFERLTYDDPAVYALLAAGDTLGVFQVESRAQTSVLPRLRPACLDDLVVAVSLIRPGPVQGQMVHPYLRRRLGEEPVRYPHPCLEPALRDTLGVLLFQEQVLLVTTAAAGWPPGRGELLRRALSKGDVGAVAALRVAFLADATSRGIDPISAERIFTQIAGFAGYSFPRSHAAAFATLVYQHAWLKRYAPVPFYVSLLNHQPMGFWSPAVLVGDAKRHGVRFLGVDINRSAEACTVEGGAIRIGLRYVGGLGAQGVARLLAARATARFDSLHDLCRRTGLPHAVVERLILGGALDLFGAPRRAMLWELGGLRYEVDSLDLELPLPAVELAPLTHWELRRQEEAVLGLTVGEHALAPLRAWLAARGMSSSRALRRANPGSRVETAGLLVVRQAPPTAKGHVFLTLEDEHGLIDIILRPRVAERYRALLGAAAVLRVVGMLQREGATISILAWHIEPLQVPGGAVG